jgi:hypothetical protein
MAATNAIVDRNIRSLQSELKANLNYFDISYKDGKSIYDGSVVLNRYKMWLQGSNIDYIRRYAYAGFLEGNLNRYPFSPESEPLIEQELRERTAESFEFIELMDVQVRCVFERRWWTIRVTVKDLLTGLIGSTGSNGIVIPYSL